MKKIEELSVLEKTLFIPLSVRAKETANENPLVVDKMAVNVLHQCDTRGITVDGGEISTHGILARTTVIDTEVKAILCKNQSAVVINLGAGLDTRFFRLDNGTVRWYDLDLPQVISLRRQFISETERLHFVSKSVLDSTWINEIELSNSDTVIIIAEGLLMYFAESEVKKINTDFLWGIENKKEVEALNKSITVVNAWSAGNLLKQRQSLAFRLLNIFPSTKTE